MNKSLKISKRLKIAICSCISVLVCALIAIASVGIYFSNRKPKPTPTKVNPAEWSVDVWDGESADNLNWFTGDEFAKRGEKTYTINSAESFIYFANLVNDPDRAMAYDNFLGYTVYLNSNINLNGHEIPSIGTTNDAGVSTFQGTFDGSFYTLYNAKINGNGLFNNLENATIKNIGLYNPTINGDGYTGGIVGEAKNTTIINTYVRAGSVNGTVVGGIAGKITASKNGNYIINSFADTTLTGTTTAGLIGKLEIETQPALSGQEAEAITYSLTNSYYAGANTAVAEMENNTLITKNVFNSPNSTDMSTMDYVPEYSLEHMWCNYSGYMEVSFNYPILTRFNKVFRNGACYEGVIVVDGKAENAETLPDAFDSAHGTTEAEINIIVEKVYVEDTATASDETTIKMDTAVETTLQRAEDNTGILFASIDNSTLILGDENATEETEKLVIDGNRQYVEQNNLKSDALVYASGYDFDLNDNVTIQNNVNNTSGYGGGVLVVALNKGFDNSRTNSQPEITGGVITNCKATLDGGGLCVLGTPGLVSMTITGCYARNGGGVAVIDELESEEEELFMETLVPSVALNSDRYLATAYSINAGARGRWNYSGTLSKTISGTYDSNTGQDYGGGAYYWVRYSRTCTLGESSTAFNARYNSANYGGGASINGNSDLNVDVVYVYLGELNKGNTASQRGGGLHVSGSGVNLNMTGRGRINDNTANQSAGIAASNIKSFTHSGTVEVAYNDANDIIGGVDIEGVSTYSASSSTANDIYSNTANTTDNGTFGINTYGFDNYKNTYTIYSITGTSTDTVTTHFCDYMVDPVSVSTLAGYTTTRGNPAINYSKGGVLNTSTSRSSITLYRVYRDTNGTRSATRTLYFYYDSSSTTRSQTLNYTKCTRYYTAGNTFNNGAYAPVYSTPTGGSLSSYGSVTMPSSSTVSSTGYTLMGWATSSSSTTTSYSPGSSYTYSGGTSLYAVWQEGAANGSYSSSRPVYFYDGTNTNSATQTVSYQVKRYFSYNQNYSRTPTSGGSIYSYGSVTAPSVSKSGYTFAGWSTSSSGTSTSYGTGTTIYPTSTSLYAVWYNTSGTRTGNTSATFYAGSGTITDPDTGSTVTGTYTKSYSSVTFSGVQKYYSYNLSYNRTSTTGGTPTIKMQRASLSGYYFQGWATSSSTTYYNYSGGSSYNTSTTSFYAVWYDTTGTRSATITLSYFAGIGVIETTSSHQETYNLSYTSVNKYYSYNLGSTRTATSGGSTTTKVRHPDAIASSQEYEFVGWATSSTSTSISYRAFTDYSPPSSSTSYYAVWKYMHYDENTTTSNTIYFYYNTGSGSSSTSATQYNVYTDYPTYYSYNKSYSRNAYTEGTLVSTGSVTVPSVATTNPSGYTLKGWSNGSYDFYVRYSATGSIAPTYNYLYAVYEENTGTGTRSSNGDITFNAGNGIINGTYANFQFANAYVYGYSLGNHSYTFEFTSAKTVKFDMTILSSGYGKLSQSTTVTFNDSFTGISSYTAHSGGTVSYSNGKITFTNSSMYGWTMSFNVVVKTNASTVTVHQTRTYTGVKKLYNYYLSSNITPFAGGRLPTSGYGSVTTPTATLGGGTTYILKGWSMAENTTVSYQPNYSYGGLYSSGYYAVWEDVSPTGTRTENRSINFNVGDGKFENPVDFEFKTAFLFKIYDQSYTYEFTSDRTVTFNMSITSATSTVGSITQSATVTFNRDFTAIISASCATVDDGSSLYVTFSDNVLTFSQPSSYGWEMSFNVVNLRSKDQVVTYDVKKLYNYNLSKSTTPTTGGTPKSYGTITTSEAPVLDGYTFVGWTNDTIQGTIAKHEANETITPDSMTNNYYAVWREQDGNGTGSFAGTRDIKYYTNASTYYTATQQITYNNVIKYFSYNLGQERIGSLDDEVAMAGATISPGNANDQWGNVISPDNIPGEVTGPNGDKFTHFGWTYNDTGTEVTVRAGQNHVPTGDNPVYYALWGNQFGTWEGSETITLHYQEANGEDASTTISPTFIKDGASVVLSYDLKTTTTLPFYMGVSENSKIIALKEAITLPSITVNGTYNGANVGYYGWTTSQDLPDNYLDMVLNGTVTPEDYESKVGLNTKDLYAVLTLYRLSVGTVTIPIPFHTGDGNDINVDFLVSASAIAYSNYDYSQQHITGYASASEVNPTITTPSATRDGYTLEGWGSTPTSTNGNNVGASIRIYVTISDEQIVLSDPEFYAVWSNTSGVRSEERAIHFYTDADNYVDVIQTNGYIHVKKYYSYNLTTVRTATTGGDIEYTEINTPNVAKEGYKLLGWTTDPNGTTVQFDSNVTPSDNINYYAVWGKDETKESKKTVTYDYVDGYSVENNEHTYVVDAPYTYTQRYNYNYNLTQSSAGTTFNYEYSTVYLLGAESGVKDGYDILCWIDEDDREITLYTDITVNRDRKFVAKWGGIEYYIKLISYDKTEIVTARYDVSSYLDYNPRTNYTFAGWTSSAVNATTAQSSYNDVAFSTWDGTLCTNKYYKNLTTVADSIIELTAVYTPKTSTLNFNANGGSLQHNETLVVTVDSTAYNSLSSVLPLRPGYVFNGWYTALVGGNRVYDAQGRAYYGDDNTMQYWVNNGTAVVWATYGEIDLYAQWLAASITVNLNANTGTVPYESVTIIYGSSVFIVDNKEVSISASKTGYNSLGWFTSLADDAVKVASNSGTLVANVPNFTDENGYWIATSTTTLYAKWSPISYSIEPDYNGGSAGGDMPLANIMYDAVITIPNPVREGYTFTGWYNASNAYENHWIHDTARTGETADNVETPWDGRNTTNIYFKNLRCSSGIANLIASWEAKTYSITTGGEYGGVIAPTSAKYGDEVTIEWYADMINGYNCNFKSITIYDGYTSMFGKVLYRFTEGTSATFTMNSTYYSNIYIYVVYEKIANEYLINYELDGGSLTEGSPTKAKFDDIINIPHPTKEGYAFVGWTASDVDADFALTGLSETNLTTAWDGGLTLNNYFTKLKKEGGASVTLTANWEIRTFDVSIVAGNGGSVDVSIIKDVAWNTPVIVNNNNLTIGDVVVTATANENYMLDYFDNPTTITENITITAYFARTYDVTIETQGYNRNLFDSYIISCLSEEYSSTKDTFKVALKENSEVYLRGGTSTTTDNRMVSLYIDGEHILNAIGSINGMSGTKFVLTQDTTITYQFRNVYTMTTAIDGGKEVGDIIKVETDAKDTIRHNSIIYYAVNANLKITVNASMLDTYIGFVYSLNNSTTKTSSLTEGNNVIRLDRTASTDNSYVYTSGATVTNFTVCEEKEIAVSISISGEATDLSLSLTEQRLGFVKVVRGGGTFNLYAGTWTIEVPNGSEADLNEDYLKTIFADSHVKSISYNETLGHWQLVIAE